MYDLTLHRILSHAIASHHITVTPNVKCHVMLKRTVLGYLVIKLRAVLLCRIESHRVLSTCNTWHYEHFVHSQIPTD